MCLGHSKGRSYFVIWVHGAGEGNGGKHYAGTVICSHLILQSWKIKKSVVIKYKGKWERNDCD